MAPYKDDGMRWHLLKNSSGSAVITVIAVVGVGLIMALAYLFGMYLEERSARMFLESVKAGYVAESLANYARVLIEKDDSYGVDGVDDLFMEVFRGSDVDLDGDGTPESRWITLYRDFRGAVFVEDETGKANLSCPALNHKAIFDYLVDNGMLSSDFSDVWQVIADYMKGADLHWGVAGKDDNYNNFIFENDGIDNDNDGQIDEIGEGIDDWTEYCPWSLYGDDKSVISVEALESILGQELTQKEFEVLSRYFSTTASSSDLDVNGLPKLNPNYISVEELADVLLACGVKDPWRKAVIIRDFLDRDFARSVIYPRGYKFFVSVSQTAPSWKEKDEQLVFSGQADKWEYWQWEGVSKGSYYVYFYSKDEGAYIGNVRVNGIQQNNIHSGEGLLGKSIYVGDDGVLKVEIQVPADAVDEHPSLQYVDLVPVEMKGKLDKRVYGIEGIRIRSVFCNPVLELSAVSAALVKSGDWIKNGNMYINSESSGGSAGEGIWEFSGIRDGTYYVQLLSGNEGDIVGDVWISGVANYKVKGGQWFSSTVEVSGGVLRIKIQNNQPEGVTCSFSGIVLSQQPDAEFVEICNLTGSKVDIGGWSLVMPDNPSSPAYIPMGTIIGAGDCMVLAVDVNDGCDGISANGISFKDVFPNGNVPVAQLDLATEMQEGVDVFRPTDKVYLKDIYGNEVDAVELVSSGAFSQLVRQDLVVTEYLPQDAEFSGWQQVNFEDIVFDSSNSQAVHFANGKVFNIEKMFDIPDGLGDTISKEDLAKMFSRLSLDEILLTPVGYVVSGWRQAGNYFIAENEGEVLELSWGKAKGIFAGMYRLVLELDPNDVIGLQLYRDGKWESFGDKLWADESGYVDLGWVGLGDSLRMKIVSKDRNVSFYAAHLFPRYHCYCKININTAPKISLLSLGLDWATVEKIVENRPYGNDFMGLGKIIDILDKEQLAMCFGNLAINSGSFMIVSLGQTLKAGNVRGEKKIWVSVKRQ